MAWKREPLNEEELDRLLEAAQDERIEEELAVRVLAHTGMRAQEYAHLRDSWIDWQSDAIQIPAEQDGWTPKTSAAVRRIPVKDPRTLRILRQWFERNEAIDVDRMTVYRRVVRVAEAVDPPLKKKVTPHVLRHTYGTLIASRGATAQYIRQTMGHADLNSANRYIQFSGSQLDTEAEKLW